ncbi:MAG: hypothetical protein JWO04_1319, partial [Gammaproteobacteria bacterium]|nr:hypothetical protein [Gammaproteobacteria bacterium]
GDMHEAREYIVRSIERARAKAAGPKT